MNTTEIGLPTSEAMYWGDPYMHLEMKVADFLLLYISPVIILFGTLGNILSLVVLQSRHYKSTPTTIALSALALADIGVLNTGLLRHWIIQVSGIDIRTLGNVSCKIHACLTYLTATLTGNILAITSMERVISVWFPLRVRDWITKQRMLLMIILVSVFYLLCHIPLYFGMELQLYYGDIYCTTISNRFHTIWHWVSMVMVTFFPVLALFLCNALLIIGLRRASIRRATKSNQKDKKTGSTTVMLIVVGVVFLLTISPGSIHLLGVSYDIWPFR